MAVRRFLKYLPCQGAGAILSKPDGDGWRSSPEGQTAERGGGAGGAPAGGGRGANGPGGVTPRGGAPRRAPPALGVWVRVWFYLG